MTNRQLLNELQKKLSTAGIEDAANDAWLIFENIAGMNRTEYLLRMNDEAEGGMTKALTKAADRRCLREPLQYILGKAYFMGLEFAVTPAVLIPRFDTEVLVSEALKTVQAGDDVLDMCTGSGCIAACIALMSGARSVTGTDISPDALDVARANLNRLGADGVKLVLSDMFDKVSGKFDVILSNPPYIRTGDIDGLMCEVKDSEPRLALDGHEDGLFFYRIFAKKGSEYLRHGGRLILEIGFDQAGDVCALLEASDFSDVTVIKDLSGLDRVVRARRK